MKAPARIHDNKFARYREKKRVQGFREIRLWVPDVRAAGFREQVAREVASLDAEDEQALMRWMEAAQSDIDWGPDYDWGADGPPNIGNGA